MNKILSVLLKDRHRLLLATIAAYIVLVVIEGVVMDRESRVYTFENPYFELQLNNIEEFQSNH
ncbi:MAG: hypothetical protein R3F41_02845 [Gammaproteobacteria bacterium]|nr:hypothetical protein [Planctomycetaceae bacterium]MCB1670631.1 hypothetical protein [Pseudomonadales bacterium]MCP5345769.1 hypothetical protein [Pseudomonadales bacterium]